MTLAAHPPSLDGLLAASGTGFDANGNDFDILNQALSATGLTAALADPDAHLTLLAPTDAAFIRLAQGFGFTGTDEAGAFGAIATTLAGLAPDGDPLPLLANVLRYHVLGESLSRTELLGRQSVQTLLEGSTISPFGSRLEDADPSFADPVVQPGGTAASNGTLLTLNGVLLPADLPGNGPAPAPLPTLAERLAASGTGLDANGRDFDILNLAISAAGLTEALDPATGAKTLLAPTDAAFIRLAQTLGFDGTDEQGAVDAILGALGSLAPDGDPLPLLRQVLSYHLIDGKFSVEQLRAEGSFEPGGLGVPLTIRGNLLQDADPAQPDARFAPGQTNIEAADGALQAIDRVLLPIALDLPPPSIADVIAGSGNGFDFNREDFDILKAALGVAGLTAALDDPEASLTLFAPTDAAFLRLAHDLGYTGRDEAEALDTIVQGLAALDPNGDPLPLLTTVLTYHVAPEALTAKEIREAPEITTLSGLTIEPFGSRLVDLDPTLPDAQLLRGRADLAAGNGFIQAIDRVLLPANIPEAAGTAAPAPTISGLLAASGTGFDSNGNDFDLLNAALQATGLDTVLADPAAELTLLAPTDAAFGRLAKALGDTSGTEEGALSTILGALGTLGGGDPLPLLGDILRFHVIDGRSSREQLFAEGSAQPLFGPELEFRGVQIIDAEPRATSRFIAEGSDQFAANGALHAITGVLLPIDVPLI
ncbi:fasciclin domain-containing protein [Paracraurococcus ruber]|nr:fasciclin domain-containing protein [Paracraurococcus ruber]